MDAPGQIEMNLYGFIGTVRKSAFEWADERVYAIEPIPEQIYADNTGTA